MKLRQLESAVPVRRPHEDVVDSDPLEPDDTVHPPSLGCRRSLAVQVQTELHKGCDGSRLSAAPTREPAFDVHRPGEPQTTITPPGAAAVTVTYDAAGNLATYTDPAGTVTYKYDAGNELVSLAQPGGSCTGTISKCTTFAYNANGARTKITYPGNTTRTATLDTSDRPTDIKAVNGTNVLSDLTYTYKKGTADTILVQTRVDKLGVGGPAGSATSYGYDTLNRLVTATEKTSAGTTNASWAYGYDKNGTGPATPPSSPGSPRRPARDTTRSTNSPR